MNIDRRITNILGSSWTFAATLVLFAFEAGWLALTSRFPMAFDEAFHYGLIQFFSHHLNPIITHQASDSYKYGALIQNPSTLYHYLMSFPYRLIAVFAHTPEAQVICLRFLNVALAVLSLIVIRKLLRLLGLSKALTNVLVLALAFTPLFTVLSAQINYDNLLILAVSACFYLTVDLSKQLAKGTFNTVKLVTLLCLCLFSSLIKYAFLPIFLAIAVLMAWKIIAYSRNHKTAFMQAKRSWTRAGRPLKLTLWALAIGGCALFIKFYGVNLAKYHNPYPQCDQVLNVQDCLHYYAWSDVYNLQQYNRQHHIEALKGIPGAVHYNSYWIILSSGELFGATMPYMGDLYGFTVFYVIVSLLTAAMFVAALRNLRKVFRQQPYLLSLLFISAAYVLVLWLKNYHDYLRVGTTIAIHGRYLLPILICIYVWLAVGTRTALAELPRGRATAKTVLALTVVISFLVFGGFQPYLTYIPPKYGHLSPTNTFHPLGT